MKKKYIKTNVDDNHLSLGNFCRVLKECSVNKSAALQVDIFCILFDIDDIQDTTVNNYCIGLRSIGDKYKQKFIVLEKKYRVDKLSLSDLAFSILSILEGKIFSSNLDISSFNSNINMRNFCLKLYNISKNDKQVTSDFSSLLFSYINDGSLFECLMEILFFIILVKKQPIYEENIKKEILESILSQTNISSNDLEEYLNLKFCEGSNYDYSLKKLANNGNAYACFELGNAEYLGHVMGYSRYDISYEYLKVASDAGHPSACYLIGRMFFNGNIGSKNNDELVYAYEMFEKAVSLGSVSALNSLGVMYLEGIYPIKKDIDKALEYFYKACEYDYVYAFNNLGKIFENKNNYEKALEYYLKSADMGESWACNKVGEFYRLAISCDKDLKKAFYYYEKALEVPCRYLCYYSKYNLARYFYLCGCMDIVPFADRNKAIKYLEDASCNGIMEASILLFYIFVDNYLKSRDSNYLNKVYEYKKKIECHPMYNSNISKDIVNKLKEISNISDIDISCII